MRELVEEPRLAYSGFADHGDDLAVARGRLFERLTQLLQLHLSPHEPGEPARRRRLQPPARPARSLQLVHLDRVGEPLDADRPDGFHGDVALSQSEGRRRDEHGAWCRVLLHARGEVRRLTDCRVVDAEIASDGPHHDLARVQTDPDLERDALTPTDVLAISPDPVLHGA